MCGRFRQFKMMLYMLVAMSIDQWWEETDDSGISQTARAFKDARPL